HTRSYGDWSSDVCSSDLRAVNSRSYPLRLAARQALADGNGRPGDGHEHIERDRHRSTGQAGLDECPELGSLALVLAAPPPRGVRSEERRVGKGGPAGDHA